MLEPEQRARVDDLLYQTEAPAELAFLVKQIANPEELFYFASEYNCDNGLAVPTAIADHPLCDMATALLLFWRADGIAALDRKEATSFQEEWFRFCESLTSRLLRSEFPEGSNSFDPQLSEVQRFKLEKSGVPAVLLNPTIPKDG